MILESFIDEANRMQAVALVMGSQGISAGTVERRSEPAGENGLEQGHVRQTRLANSAKTYSAIQYYASSMLVMFLLYSGLTAASSLLREKEAHTLMRLQLLPVSPIQIIAGKWLGNGLLAGIQAAVIILITAYVYGVDWGDSAVYLILVSAVTIFASMALALNVAFLFRSSKTVGSVFAAVIGVMTFVSGGMFPADGTVLEILQPYTVNYWAADSFIRLMTGQDKGIVMGNMCVLGGLGLLFILFAFGLYRKVGYHE